jgi:ParB family chromosome partitioning protein
MATSASKTTRTRTARSSAPAGQVEPSTEPQPMVTTAPQMSLQWLDPRSLLLEGNIRGEADLDEAFVASIRERGVMQPIVAIQTEQGVQVRFGQRRTLGAIKAERDLVPVVVVDAQDSDEAARIIDQWHENEQRRGLSVADKIGAAEQLAAFGIPAEQIGKELGASTAEITHALAAAKSELARKAAPRYELTLEQSAAVAEFDQDPEAVKLLVLAARQGPVRFEHELERLRTVRAVMALKADAEAKLAKAKVRLITHEHGRTAKVARLSELASVAPSGKTCPPAITVAQHKKCPGHAAYLIVRDWSGTVETVYACTDWQEHGHHQRYVWNPGKTTKTVDPETAREQRLTVIANNKAWDTATGVRRRWLKTFLARKSPDKGSAAFLAGELMLGGFEIRRAMKRGSAMLSELLGYKDREALKAAAAAAANVPDARAQVLCLAVVLAAIEESLSRETWRNPSSAAVRYLAFLTQHGYQLSDVEQLVLPKPKASRKTSTKAATGPAEATTVEASTSSPDPTTEAGPAAADGTAA